MPEYGAETCPWIPALHRVILQGRRSSRNIIKSKSMFLLLKTAPQDAVYNSKQCFLKSVFCYFSQFPFSFSSSYQILT